MSDGERDRTATRRDVLKIAGALALGRGAASAIVAPAQATPAEMQAAVASIVGEARDQRPARSSSTSRRWSRTATRCRAR